MEVPEVKAMEVTLENYLSDNFDQVDKKVSLSPLVESDFHMILRSPKFGASPYPKSASVSKSRRSSKKTKTPSKMLTEDDIDVDECFFPEQSILMQMMQASSAECSPQKKNDEAILPSKSKIYRGRPLMRVHRSSLYAPTKSTIVKQRIRSSTGMIASELGSSMNSNKIAKSKCAASCKPKGPTIPLTPKFKSDERSRMHVKSVVLSTEDREMLAIGEARKIELQRVQKAKKVFQWVKHHSSTVVKTVVRSTKELTVPTTPVSHLRKRKGQKICSNETGIPSKEEEKVEESFHNRPPTQFEPFQFATDSRMSVRITENPNKVQGISIAEAREKYFQDSRSHGAPTISLKLTQGHAPNFLTDIRALNDSRPKMLSSEEIEELEYKEMQENKFKAKPIDQRIFQSMGELGVPKVPAKKATEQVPFGLKSVYRVRANSFIAPTDAERAASATFKARPMPTHQDMIPKTPLVQQKLTIAISPKLSGCRASSAPARRQRVHHTVAEEDRRVAAALAAVPLPRKLTLTEPQEFRLETNDRGLAHRALLEQREREEAVRASSARNVHALPVPDQSRPYHVKQSSKELTEFKEFNLQSVALHGSEKIAQKLESKRSEEDSKEKMQFQARSLPRSTFEPTFQVEVENRPPTVSVNPNFQTDVRVVKRREFDELKTLKTAELEEQREILALKKLDAENLQIRELRKLSTEEGGMAFKAAPIMHKDPYPSRHSTPMPLTEPRSPAFSTMVHRNSINLSKDNEMAAAFQQM